MSKRRLWHVEIDPDGKSRVMRASSRLRNCWEVRKWRGNDLEWEDPVAFEEDRKAGIWRD